MNDINSRTVCSGVSGATLLGIAFVILKLCKIIDWSWGWVLAPFWIPIVLVAAVIVIMWILAFVINRG